MDEMFMKQGMQMTSQCSLCKRTVETSVHLFQECPFITGLWTSLAALFDLGPLPKDPWERCVDVRKCHLSTQLWALWKVRFFEVLWMIWHVRNQARHDEKHLSLSAASKQIYIAISTAKVHKIGHIHNTVKELFILRKIGVQGTPRKPTMAISVFWSPPKNGVIKVNVDGAVSRGKVAAVGVFRFFDGRVLAAFSAPLILTMLLKLNFMPFLLLFDKLRLWD